jgi:hypothetical protein
MTKLISITKLEIKLDGKTLIASKEKSEESYLPYEIGQIAQNIANLIENELIVVVTETYTIKPLKEE